jgi:hypothetical protein
MKTKITLLLLALCLSVGAGFAQDPAAMEAWMAAMKPGAEHDFLKKMEGKWKIEVTSTMGSVSDVTKGKVTKKMIMGGRYLEEDATSEMMGQPFMGKNIFGYDNITQKYRTSWIDNMGTGIMAGEGTRDGNTITIWSTYPNVGGAPDMKYKMLYIVDNDKKHRYEMYMIDEKGQEAKQMTIVYTR